MSSMNRPRAHVWVDIPDDCRFESTVIAEDVARVVIGHPAADGHTLEPRREALSRLHTVLGNTIEAMDNGTWVEGTTWVSDPAETAATDAEAPVAG